MLVLTLALAILTALCLAYDTTRWFGVAGVALLVVLYPLFFSALTVLAGVAFLAVRYYQRRTIHELPQLPDRRD